MIWHKFDATDESTWPPLSTDVLVVRKVWNGRIIRRGYLSACYKKAFYVEGDIIPVGEITHWRPMPDLPVEGYEHREDFIRQIKESAKTLDAENKGGEYVLYCTADVYSLIAELRSARMLPLNIVEIQRIPPSTKIPSGMALLCPHGKEPVSVVFEQSGVEENTYDL